jgi:hypothetical protein
MQLKGISLSGLLIVVLIFATNKISAQEHEEGEKGEVFGWETHGFTRNHEIVLAEFLLLFVVLLCTSLVLQFYVGKVWKWHYLPESGATVLLGMLIGR